MEPESLAKRIFKQGLATNLLGLTLTIMRVTIGLTISGDFTTFIAQICMSVTCFITGFSGRRASRVRKAKIVKRYAFLSLLCFIIWGILGLLSTIMQIIYLYNASSNKQADLGIVFAAWLVLYIIGLYFLRLFRVGAIMYAKTFLYGQDEPIAGAWPDANPKSDISGKNMNIPNPETVPEYPQGTSADPQNYTIGNASNPNYRHQNDHINEYQYVPPQIPPS
ncbi:hypothetical protein SteCoe_18216 [Stentor coeruleus]|uniref:MARVEL domain-containing protein n=1 Tax=Stentor coeruleus TaxID=5963 RepID=A0A1R2BX28_9CILI|nr:hypothetical protein SteCoe_18216 [Stentor coeruleus]